MTAKIKINPKRLPKPRLRPTYSQHIEEPIPDHIKYQMQEKESWAPEERAEVKQRHKENARKAHPRAYSPEMEDRIWKMYQEGKTYQQIADAVGRTRKAIENRIRVIKAKKEGKR